MTSSVSSLVLLVAILVVTSSSSLSCLAYQCGDQGGGALCAVGLCCSKWGWCGTTDAYCAPGNCHSQCPTPSPVPPPPPPTSPPPAPSPPPPVYDITDTIDRAMYDEQLNPKLNLGGCVRKSYFNYDNFVAAARSFPGFGTTGDIITRKREVAAFLGQIASETFFVPFSGFEIFEYAYCHSSKRRQQPFCIRPWPCVPNVWYHGRGPIMLKYNYNYIQAGEALGLGLDLLNDPDILIRDPIVGFKTAVWFWMTEQLPKPSCHDVMIGNWTPSAADLSAQRVPGYGLTTNIITSNYHSVDIECGSGQDERVERRITFYKRACDILGVDPGLNLDCFEQEPYNLRSKLWNTE